MISLHEKKGAIFDLGSTLIEYENIPWSELFKLSLKRAYDYLPKADIKQPDFDRFYDAFLEHVIKVEEVSLITQKEKDILELFANFLREFDISNSPRFLNNFLDIYYQPVRESIGLKENAVEVLEHFRSKGHKIGLISNTVFPAEYHLEDMRTHKIDKYFDHAMFSSEFPRRKPHPSIYAEMLRKLDISASEAFFIGDRIEIDVLGAKASGIFAILIKKHGRDYGDLSMPDLIIDNLSELLNFY